jgi:hypothetical protein
LPPNYSINIVGFDSTTLYSSGEDIKYKGKMSCDYDDRNGIYKLLSEDTSITNNKAVLNYVSGDRVSIRNTANPTNDFIINPATNTNVYLKTVLYKRPSNSPFNVNNGTTGFTQVFEWESSATNPVL